MRQRDPHLELEAILELATVEERRAAYREWVNAWLSYAVASVSIKHGQAAAASLRANIGNIVANELIVREGVTTNHERVLGVKLFFLAQFPRIRAAHGEAN